MKRTPYLDGVFECRDDLCDVTSKLRALSATMAKAYAWIAKNDCDRCLDVKAKSVADAAKAVLALAEAVLTIEELTSGAFYDLDEIACAAQNKD